MSVVHLHLESPVAMPLETNFKVGGWIDSDEEVEQVRIDPGYVLSLVTHEEKHPDGKSLPRRIQAFAGTGYHYSLAGNMLAIHCRLASGCVHRQEFRLRPRPEPTFVDVFESGFRLPPTVCILAPGPNGRPHYHRIPRECCVIAVNKAVLIPDIRSDVWVLNQLTDECIEWYALADGHFHGTRIYRKSAAIQMPPSNATEGYYFTVLTAPFDQLAANRDLPIENVVRSGGSVAGCAIQLAYNLGATEIMLCGVDMSGDNYWDGTRNVQQSHGAVWPVAQNLNRLIKWLMLKKNVSVSSLSPTKLDVEVRV